VGAKTAIAVVASEGASKKPWPRFLPEIVTPKTLNVRR
jgi:hypothetical protein